MDRDVWNLFDPAILPRDGDCRAFLKHTLDRCKEWFEASDASLFLSEEGTDTYRLVAKAGFSASIPADAMIENGVGLAGETLAEGRPRLIDDKIGLRSELSSAMIVPLITINGKKLGVMNLAKRQGSAGFSQDDLDHANRVGHQIAMAVGNAQLLAETQQSQQEQNRLRRLAEIGQMTASIAHEVRNPLTGIRSAAHMIIEMPEQAHEFAAIIEDEVMKLNRLCEEFLEFSRPVAMRTRPTDLSQLVRSVADLEEEAFREAGISLIVDLPVERPTIQADPLRIEQVVRNLVRNAREACEPGAKVELSVRGNGIEVKDNGCGMSSEQVNQLFVPFFTTKPQGTGLGLSNVRKIVESHGGTIEVKSKIGSGTQFNVCFGSAA